MTTTNQLNSGVYGADSRPTEMPGPETVRDETGCTFGAARAASDLGLKRNEFELAVYLGAVRVRSGPDGRPRIDHEEIARLRAQDGFPGALRERVRTVGTAEGARLLGISPARFTRLARAGCLTPVAFYLNRYRAVVWVYLAQELEALASRSPELLVGNSPPWMRGRLDAGADWRPRNWRSRRIERLLALTDDPWVRAAIVAQGLDPVQLAEVVDDPYERAHFTRIRPEAVFGRRGSVAGREAMARLMTADEPDEILWRRISLITELDAAREARPAPRPGDAVDEALSGPPVSVRPREQGVAALPADPAGPGPGPVEPGPEASGPVPALVGHARPEGPLRLLARLRGRAARGLGLRRPRHGGLPRAVRPGGGGAGRSG
ncbi:DUF6397 family protein [Streptomyces drozdowiczii]|uniref:DUF6397 family protein n=1 Tax=Streptomyces drozdowiczii TaxID=202862 RepID=A0ABY6PMC2_9ACTN|nr:DUF6397 family protein [Streptomyces drozdowiczii]MCX0247703.1 DUF6397 family protein [Streptomyces drozdowiczii]UZK52926.1 DUF6397 family protein [Streptomyces drozdowiczii]